MMGKNPAWLPKPIQLHSSRAFECDELTAEQCNWYIQRWHYWYIADYVFALPTVAFFMCAIGIFITGHAVSQIIGYRRFRGPMLWQKLIASIRYLSYRGFHVKSLQWNSAPVGILLLGLAGIIFFFCMDLIPQPYYWPSEIYGNSPALATRSGWMSLACMPFIFATASKANWITLFTGVSYERLQVFHRWISYAFFILALLHTFPFIVYHVRWHDMEKHFVNNLVFYWTGIVALLFQAWLTFASHSTIRNLGYEIFKMTHLFAVVIFMITFFWHCGFRLTSWDYFIATAAVYVPCYVYPWLRTCFEYGVNSKARLLQKTVALFALRFQQIFIGFRGSIVSCDLRALVSHMLSQLTHSPSAPCLQKRLYQHALDKPGGSVSVLVDGPYGGINIQRYQDSDQLLIISGGSGAGWCLPFVEQIARHRMISADEEQGQVAHTDDKEATVAEPVGNSSNPGPLSLRVILATRDASCRTWFLGAMNELLAKYSKPDLSFNTDIQVEVYLTYKEAQPADLESKLAQDPTSNRSVSSTNKNNIKEERSNINVLGREFEGRPKLLQIIQDASNAADVGQSLSVFVCGPTMMQNDVRNAVAEENLKIIQGSKTGAIYLHTEHFSWA